MTPTLAPLVVFFAVLISAAAAVVVEARCRHQPRVVDPEKLDEMLASITVYDVVDGRVVNRRHAYPKAAWRVSVRKMTRGFNGFQSDLQDRMFGGLAESMAGVAAAADRATTQLREAFPEPRR